MDPIESVEYNGFETTNGNSHNNDHGWKKVVYPKRNRKQKPADQAAAANGVSGNLIPNGNLSNGGDNVFRSLEEQAEDRHRRILAAKKASDAADASDGGRSKRRSNGYGDEGYDFDDSDSEIAVGKENLKAEEVKKPKVKKEKKPKVTLAEAAAKIDVSNLAAFLVEASESYATQPEIQLMRYADYFGRALSQVSLAHFPWVKTFKESPLSKLIDIPLSHIPEAVYKTSADWISQRPIEALGAFVLWGLDCILTDLAVQQGGAKGGKKGAQHASSKSQVAIFVTVAMVLRKKPDALTNILPTLRENPKYQGQDKLPVTVWMMAQASHGDISVGLYSWAHNLLPVVSSKSCNPQSRDLILQLVERILSNPKARTILVNGAVRKGERLIPPPSFEILVRLTFPASSARVKATERFEAIYPLLKEVSLAGAPGSKAMKQVTQQIFTFALKAAGEGNPVLAKEAAAITIWALTQNVDCCKHWENLYSENLEASVAVLKMLIDEWKERSVKLTPAETLTLNQTMKSLRQKNEVALAEGGANGASQSLYKDADKCCKVISGKLSSGGCIKSIATTAALLAATGFAGAAAEPENEAAELEKQLIEIEEAGLTITAASRLLTRLLDSECFRQSVDMTHYTELLRKILRSSLPLHYKEWVAACLVKLNTPSSLSQSLNNPINVEVTLYKTIPSLVEQLSFSSSPEAKEAAVLELNRIISEGVPESSQTLASHGGIEPLVKLLEERNERCVEASLSVLYNLSMDSENHTAIIRAGAVPVLRRIVMSQRPQWEKALRLLRNLPV